MHPVRLRQRHLWIGALLSACIAGMLCGVLFQRYVGLGTVLRGIGVWERPPEAKPVATRAPVGVPARFHGQMALFVLAGQSNMSGYGEVPAEQEPHPRAFMFGNDYQWRLALEPVDSEIDQVDRVLFDHAAGVGPGLAFARSLLEEDPQQVVGLIPCAKGNTSIQQWQRNLSDQSLFGACLKRLRAASPMGELAGILFFQGEADALDPEQNPQRELSAHNYREKFVRFVDDLRTDVAAPRLPVVFAQIGSHTAPLAFINWREVQEQQGMVDLPCTAMITTSDLPLMDDVHFTTGSYERIGQRFATAYLRLVRSQDCQR